MNPDRRESGAQPVKSRWARVWHQPSNLLWIYLLLMLGSLWLWHGAQQVAREQIPYSEFLQYLNKGEVKDAVLTDEFITGELTLVDPQTHQPRPFLTVRPDDDGPFALSNQTEIERLTSAPVIPIGAGLLDSALARLARLGL